MLLSGFIGIFNGNLNRLKDVGGNHRYKPFDFDIHTLASHVRKMVIVEFENPPPLMLKVLSALA